MLVSTIFLIPMTQKLLASEANLREHWTKRKKRHDQQRFLVYSKCNEQNISVSYPCSIKLTRIAPRKLDDDNLRTCLKHCRDSIADYLIPGLAPGRADEKISWDYAQDKGKPKEYILKVEINYSTSSR